MLGNDLAKFAKHLEKKLLNVERGVNYYIMADLVNPPNSPVGDPALWKSAALREWALATGYVGGAFKGNWQYGLNYKPEQDLPDSIDKTGRVSIDRVVNGINAITKVGNVHYIVNNRPYAQKLEQGWSSQAPSGIVSPRVKFFTQTVNYVVKQVNK